MKNIPYARQSINDSDARAVAIALKSGWLTQGPCVREFEEMLCSYTGAKYAAALSSGTAALHLSMLALDIGKGDEVVTSPITFSASANCAIYAGARPVFVDIDDLTYQLDTGKLQDLLSSRSAGKSIKSVIPVHFMGMPGDMSSIARSCSGRGIRIVEDAAHALGASYVSRGRQVKVGASASSDAAILSFHPIKHITTGEGGAVLTNDKKTYERILRLRHHGIVRRGAKSKTWSYDIPEVGFNYRITDIQCALGISQLKRAEAFLKMRRAVAAGYDDGLAGIDEVRLPYERPGTKSSYHLYVIRVPEDKRNELYNYLRRNGVLTQVNYLPVHLFSYYRKKFGFRNGDFPVAEKYSRECLSLPMYADLGATDQRKVIDKIRKFFRK